uniref:Bax inhibitor 1 n=1 Tax=Strongyloides venezuelensis TaxID=75913 RepID=A0A0K0EWL0_STRVS
MTTPQEFLYRNEDEKNSKYPLLSRVAFLKKTIFHTLVFLAFTAITVYFITRNNELKILLNQQYLLFSTIAMILCFTIYGAIIKSEKIRFTCGINYIAGLFMAASLGFLIAIQSCWYPLEINVNAIFMSFIVSSIISVMAFKSEKDFTIHMKSLIILTFIYAIISIVLFILSKFMDVTDLRCLCSIGGFLLSCAYVVVDTQSISTKERYNQLSTNEYIRGSVQMLVDLSYLFYYCLDVLGREFYSRPT